ncbi:MAG: dephospho-CoA kinase [Calditerrivibrio sp.]|nr:dephospho-CoA kinase [Calditerrivibrio sp.]MCA1933296.1 dephospho-CoA kinase [Calditerrivibrio sp.]MCA1980618.1 dephospho-CoA kinase [Calditerrivibrio sp.]
MKELRYLGLTGGIATGKSTIAKFFEELGCYTIDADNISRIVMAKGGSAYKDIIENFPDVLDDNGEINRGKLKKIVFNDQNKRLLLESIVHPKILEYEKKLVGEIKGKDDRGIIITQAALIIEKGTYNRFDGIILVYLDKDTQIKRVVQRDNISEDEAKRIIDAQMSYEEKLKYANFVIDNSKDLIYTQNEVKRVFELIKKINYGIKHQKN